MKKFFRNLNVNKRWDEKDWEEFFRAQDDFRLARWEETVRKEPIERIRFLESDAVEAFSPIMREYASVELPPVVRDLGGRRFKGDDLPGEDYFPTVGEDPHFWTEGAPLARLIIYRDCCRFAIFVSKEIDRFLGRKKKSPSNLNKAKLESLRFHAYWIAISVGQGHKIGYAPERIHGNIAKALRALKHADLCVRLINRLSTRTKARRIRQDLFSFAIQLRNGLFEWVDELRSHTRT